MPVRTLATASVISTGPSTGASVLCSAIRSTSEEARMPVMAAVEVSGAPTANGSELPSASTAASTAEVMKVMPTP